jgi:hypothetical protein
MQESNLRGEMDKLFNAAMIYLHLSPHSIGKKNLFSSLVSRVVKRKKTRKKYLTALYAPHTLGEHYK